MRDISYIWIVVLLLCLLPIVNAGCFTSLALPHPRTGVGIAVDKIDNKIYFAGGFSDRTRSPTNEVDVLDLTTDTWTSFQLPAASIYINVIVYESVVIFAGGVGSGGILAYHKNNGTFTTILEARTEVQSLVIGSTAYIYHAFQTKLIIAIDMTTLVVTKYTFAANFATRHTRLATNGTHWFMLESRTTDAPSSIYSFQLGDSQIQPTRLNIQLPYLQEIYIVNGNLVLVGPNQIAEISISDWSLRLLPPLTNMNMQGALQVGQDIHVFAPNQLTIISPNGITQYSIGQVYFVRVTSAVEFNGRLYFSSQLSAGSIMTINTNALFKQYQLFASGIHYAVNGFHFEVFGNLLQYVKLSTGQLFPKFLRFQTVDSAVTSTVFVTIDIGGSYHMFNTETETWTDGTTQMSERTVGTVVIRDLIVFDAVSYCYLFNTTSLEWTTIQVQNRIRPLPMHDALVFTQRNPTSIATLRIFEISSGQWKNVTIPVAEDQLLQVEYATVAYKDLLFIAGGYNAVKLPREYHDDVFIVNITDGSFKHEHLSSPRGSINALTVGDFVIFAGGIQGNTVPVIDIYNVITSEWRSVTLINRFVRTFNVIPFQNSLFIARPNGVELCNG